VNTQLLVADDFTRWWSAAFDLRRTSHRTFENAPPPPIFDSLYGGQIAAQLLVAAAHTVSGDRHPHSLHTSFVRPGNPRTPTEFDVATTRESRSLSTRHVQANQGDRTIAIATVSFHAVDTGAKPAGIAHERGTAEGEMPAPEQLPERLALVKDLDGIDATAFDRWPVDVRYVDHLPWDMRHEAGVDARNRLWLRTVGDIPEVPGRAEAAMTLATDLLMYEPVLFPTDVSWIEAWGNKGLGTFSIDHVLWFHRSTSPGEWFSVEQVSPIADRGRGFSQMVVRNRDRRIVASVAQEVLLLDTAAT